MYNENQDKLNELLTMRLDEAISNRTDFEDYNNEPYLEAMKIAEVINNIDKQETELEKTKMDIKCRENSDDIKAKIERDRLTIERDRLNADVQNSCIENNIERSKNNSQTALRVLEIAAAVVVAPIVEHKFRKGFAKMICEFEKDYNFTTTAGRSLSKLFKLQYILRSNRLWVIDIVYQVLREIYKAFNEESNSSIGQNTE